MQYPDDIAEKAVAAYQSGQSLPEVEKAFGITTTTVRRWLRERGLKPRSLSEASRVRTERKRTPELLDAIVADYTAGMPQREIAEKHRVGMTTVNSWLVLRGIARRGYSESVMLKTARRVGMSREDMRASVAAWYQSGESAPTIARRIGLAPRTVFDLLREAGVAPRSQSESNGLLHLKRHASIRGDAIADYQNGFSAKEVSEKYRVADKTVREWLRDASIPLRSAGESLAVRAVRLGAEVVAKGKKMCPMCGEEKLLSEFNRHQGAATGVASHCRKCHRFYKEKKYGMRPGDYARLHDFRNGVCAICGLPELDFFSDLQSRYLHPSLRRRAPERRGETAGTLQEVLQRSAHDRPLEKPTASTASVAPP